MGINISPDADTLSDRRASISIAIVSDVRFIREALVEIFRGSGRVNIVGAVAEFDASFEKFLTLQPDIVLIDTAFPSALVHVRRTKQIAPRLHIIALALADREDDVIAWAESGISGYIPRSAGLNELLPILDATLRGEQACSPRVASGLMRRVAAGWSPAQTNEPLQLTRRESEILQLINEGLSNKEISKHLMIAVATTKSHVHSLLAKLGLNSRRQAAYWMHGHAQRAVD
jgi:two-component system, NarL family, nitrate/nitrite response regulator NarL